MRPLLLPQGRPVAPHVLAHVDPVLVHRGNPVGLDPVPVRHSPTLRPLAGLRPPNGIHPFDAVIQGIPPLPRGEVVPLPFLLAVRISTGALFRAPVFGRLELFLAVDADHGFLISANGNRTRVSSVRGMRPRPLDDSA